MHRTAILLASLGFVTGSLAGSATVVNGCSFPVYYVESAGSSIQSQNQIAPGASSGFAFKTAQSIKVSKQQGSNAVVQFEISTGGGLVYYDTSNIDGNPFAAEGTRLAPSRVGANPECVVVDCPAGQATCNAAYNLPDDVRTKSCPIDSDITFMVCSGNSGAAPQGNSPSQDNGIAAPEAAPASQAKSQEQPQQGEQQSAVTDNVAAAANNVDEVVPAPAAATSKKRPNHWQRHVKSMI